MTSAIAIVGVAITAMLLCHCAFPLAVRWRQLRRMRRQFRNRIALTFDDGPDADTTPLVLDLLKRFNATASFFIVGFRADRQPDIVQRIVTDGHEVGCHSYWHRNFLRRSPWTGVADLTQAYSALSRWMPPDAPYRPPFGILTGWQWLALLRRGSAPVWWTHDVGDTFELLPDPKRAARSIIETGGGVLLLHCFHKDTARREFVLAFTEHLLRTAAQRRIEVVPLFRVIKNEFPASTIEAA